MKDKFLEERPFWFGGAAEDQYFTDREEDTRRLKANFLHGVNTIMISPRRWGKTSLVVKSAKLAELENANVKVVRMDIFSCRTPQDFCDRFATELIRQTSSKVEEWIEQGKRLLAKLSPVFSFGVDPFNDFSVKFDMSRSVNDIDEVLNLGEKLALEKGKHLVICIDEFQQIGEFEKDNAFQKRMRGIWQLQKHVNYCLYGSKRHMMLGMFGSQDSPFYKFGDIINLKRIPEEYWIEYICGRFTDTGKEISKEIAAEICRLAGLNSSYVQQLSWLVWNFTEHTTTAESLRRAFGLLLDQQVALFEGQTLNLTAIQFNLLLAMADGIRQGLSSQDVIDRYSLRNSASVSAAMKALEKKELIYKDERRLEFTDPLLPVWLKKIT